MSKARIGVLGAGLMGHGIAQIFALHGHDVVVYDPVQAALDSLKTRVAANLRDLGEDEGAVARVSPSSTIEDAVKSADFVVVSLPDRDAADPHELLFADHPDDRRTLFRGAWRS